MPLPPPPFAALTSSGIADARRRGARLVERAASPPGTTGTPAAAIVGARALFFAHHANGFARRPDERHAPRRAELGEIRVLREKPVARVERVAPGASRRVDEAFGVEVRARVFAERPGFVRAAHVQRFAVDVRVNGNRREPSSRAVRATRMAISPRLAMRSFLNIVGPLGGALPTLRANAVSGLTDR